MAAVLDQAGLHQGGLHSAASAAHIDYLLRLADSSLVLGQRLAEWTGHGPVLEEDIAMANVALDLIGQARLLLAHAGKLEARMNGIKGADAELGENARDKVARDEGARDEDALAYFRDARAYRNFTICELPNSGIAQLTTRGQPQRGDYAFTIVRNLLFCAWQAQLWAALQTSSDTALAAIAAKSAKETAYHLRHAADWVIRFGDGTTESHARAQRALNQLWPYTNELFSADATEDAVSAQGIGVPSSSLHAGWSALVGPILADSTLKTPAQSGFQSNGKLGIHSEHLDTLLIEMQSLARAHPGARW